MGVVLLGVVIVVAAAGQWIVLYQLLAQQGRLLNRLDALEERLLGGASHHAAGFEVGREIDAFALPTVDGGTLSLDALRGKAALLVNWSPNCGFCAQIAPALAESRSGLAAKNVELVLLAHGDADSNTQLAAEHGLDCVIALQPDDGGLEAFGHLGTPVAYLVDDEGHVARPLAIGADEVVALAREIAGEAAKPARRLRGQRPISDSRIERNGLKQGSVAPSFRLPDVHGDEVALDDYRGRRVLLAFTDPDCGPCETILPELEALHDQGDMAVLMISRGDPDANRRKVDEHGIGFPVLLQNHWEVSRRYGIFVTPVSFLIDEQGVTEAAVARGAEDVRAMASSLLLASVPNEKG